MTLRENNNANFKKDSGIFLNEWNDLIRQIKVAATLFGLHKRQ